MGDLSRGNLVQILCRITLQFLRVGNIAKLDELPMKKGQVR